MNADELGDLIDEMCNRVAEYGGVIINVNAKTANWVSLNPLSSLVSILVDNKIPVVFVDVTSSRTTRSNVDASTDVGALTPPVDSFSCFFEIGGVIVGGTVNATTQSN